MRNTKTVLMSVLMIGIVALVAGAGTFAYFSDVETSSGNTFTAGTIDLTPDNPGTFVTGLGNLAPAEDNPAQSTTLTNNGTLDAATMNIDVNITGEADGTGTQSPTSPDGTGVNMTANEYAETLKVETLTWKGTDLLGNVTESVTDGNNYKDLAEVAAADLSGQAGLNSSESGDFVIDVTLDPDDAYGNNPQGDGVVISVQFDLEQV
jgi:spore coat-associated protein N